MRKVEIYFNVKRIEIDTVGNKLILIGPAVSISTMPNAAGQYEVRQTFNISDDNIAKLLQLTGNGKYAGPAVKFFYGENHAKRHAGCICSRRGN